jgi:hypothetical protein
MEGNLTVLPTPASLPLPASLLFPLPLPAELPLPFWFCEASQDMSLMKRVWEQTYAVVVGDTLEDIVIAGTWVGDGTNDVA